MAKPPVVFLNGYQLECPGRPGTLEQFRATFGLADEILQRNGQVTLFFDSCSLPNRPPIENLAQAFGALLSRLRYQDGQPVTQVDVVAHSMGGLILRGYLAGKQTSGTFIPPADTHIRKAVFLGTPHFGSAVTSLFPGTNPQIEQIRLGSEFLFDLATWNQGIDDLRGVDAITILGNAGNDSGLAGRRVRFDDSTVTLTSGALDFYAKGRTRIVNSCHTSGLADLLCSRPQGYLAQMTSDTHESARAMISFFNSTGEWAAVGEAPEANSYLSRGGGLAVRWKDANDRPLAIESADVAGQNKLSIQSSQIGYTDLLPAQPLQLTLQGPAGSTGAYSLSPFAGGTRALILKSGPSIAAIYPSAAAVFPRSLAPGMFISIYGANLSSATVQASGLPYPTTLGAIEVRLNGDALALQYVSPSQVNAVVPESAGGLSRLTVASPAGEQTLNVLVEPAVPALFGAAINALSGALVTPDNPARPGDHLSFFLTGLGATDSRDGLLWARIQPQVTVDGKSCDLLYAGRAPGYVGLDQINCRLAQDLTANAAAAVLVRSGNRASNIISLPIR